MRGKGEGSTERENPGAARLPDRSNVPVAARSSRWLQCTVEAACLRSCWRHCKTGQPSTLPDTRPEQHTSADSRLLFCEHSIHHNEMPPLLLPHKMTLYARSFTISIKLLSFHIKYSKSKRYNQGQFGKEQHNIQK